MINVEKLGIILSSTNSAFENKAVTNSGIYQDGNTLHILYSALNEENIYTIGYAKTEGPNEIIKRNEQAIITNDTNFETKGVKNPKIVKINDLYYITYTACDDNNLMGALATSSDLIHFHKHGVITPCINYKKYGDLIKPCHKKLSDKYYEHYKLYDEIGIASKKNLFLRDEDILLFPKKINGKFVLLQHIFPSIQIVRFNEWDDLTISFWEDYLKNLIDFVVFEPDGKFEVDCIGLGCPPIETEFGWLLIYQGVQMSTKGKIFNAMAALLQINKPENILSRLPYPLFSPTQWWEKEGEVHQNSVTPSGAAIFEENLYVYYGASNKYLAVAKMNLNELLYELVSGF